MMYNTGCIIEKIDDRDDQAEEVLGAGLFDWKKGFEIGMKLKVESQGQSKSCCGQAISKYAEVFMNNKDLSARDVYSRIFLEEWGGGAWLRDGMSLIVKRGVCGENMASSYECFETKDINGFRLVCNSPSEKFMRIVPKFVEEDALKAKAERYAVIKHQNDIDTVADIVSRSQGAVTGVKLSKAGWSNPPFVKPPQRGEKTYGHAIYLGKVRMIKGKKYIGFLNSYGKGWGSQGWGWLGEDYFKSNNVFNIRVFYYSNNKKMKIIGLLKDEKRTDQFAVGENGVFHKINSVSMLEELHGAGVLDKNVVEWRDELDGIVGSEWGSLKGDY